MESRHNYYLFLYRLDRSLIKSMGLDVDWEPAIEWTRFQGLSQEALGPQEMAAAAAIEPCFRNGSASPILTGFQVRVGRGDGRLVAHDFPLDYFRPLAQQAASLMVERGLLKTGERFYYLVLATRIEERAPASAAGAPFLTEDAAPDLPIHTGDIEVLRARSTRCGPTACQDPFAVFIPRRVIDEAAGLTGHAGSHETGGILIGHLRRDAATRGLFVEVTAQVAAPHVVSTPTRLTFTPETWVAVKEAIARRGLGEVWTGHWHSHSFLKETCVECPEKNAECGMRNAELNKQKGCGGHARFFSEEDVYLHRTCFYRAWNVGLVVSDARCTGTTYALYGWRQGSIIERGYNVLDVSRSLPPEET